MPAIDHERVAFRRKTYDLKANISLLADELDGIDNEAARAVNRARSALFEAWTILCAPPTDDDDDNLPGL